MFLTRSIRRKLVIGLGLVCLMLGILALAVATGLMSYGAIVRDLEYSLNHEPRRSDLAVACASLFEPILQNRAEADEQFLRFDVEAWCAGMQRVEVAIKEFRRRVERLPSSPDAWQSQSVILWKLNDIRVILVDLEQRRKSLDQNVDRQAVLNAILRDVSRIQAIIEKIPNPELRTQHALRQAPAQYQYWLWLTTGCLLVIGILMISLVRCGHFWFFVPIRKLHEAASRVANGDYAFRLKLRGRDEMVDLANVFNRMIERFQNDKEKLDREVEVRSRQLLRNERLAGIGFLATGIAHEINNPLSAIAMAAESLIDRMKESGEQFGATAGDRELLSNYLEMIQRQSYRCQQITSRVLDFSRNSDAPRKRHDLTKIVSEVLDVVSHMSRFGQHSIKFDRSRPHYVDVNASEMQQVVLNLVANGLEAMESAGRMTIGISESLDEVVLTVQDTGCGMTPHVLANLYEPFFTEKLPGKKGTGLGMSITNRIVAEHQGRIEASSDGPGKGSTFQVHLPRSAGGIARAA